MRLDSANRSFLALMSLALLLGMYVLCGAVGSVLVPLVVARISHEGIDGLLGSGGAMLPVLLFIILVGVWCFSMRPARRCSLPGCWRGCQGSGRSRVWRGDRPACRCLLLNRNPPTKALSGRGA